MLRKSLIRRSILCAAALTLNTAVLAGAVLHMESKDFTEVPPAPGKVVMSVEDEVMRMDMSGREVNDRGSMIFDGTVNQMTAVDHASQSYYVLDEQAMQGMASQMGSAMQQMQEALADLPPEQRAMAEQMMKQRFGGAMPDSAPEPDVDVRRTGDDDTVNGYDCEVYAVSEGGVVQSELCVADWDDIEGGREFAGGMKSMARFFEKMRDTFAQAGADVMGGSDNVLAYMEEIDGFPVRARSYAGGELVDETVIVSSESKTLDSEIFAPPAGYRRQSMQP